MTFGFLSKLRRRSGGNSGPEYPGDVRVPVETLATFGWVPRASTFRRRSGRFRAQVALRGGAGLRGPLAGRDWDFAAQLGCPEQAWVADVVDAHAAGARASERIFRAMLVGANKGYGLARLLKLLTPELGVTPATWGASLRQRGAALACGWCRDCLADADDDAVVAQHPGACHDDPAAYAARPPRGLEAHLVEPLSANVALLENALRDHGFIKEEGAWRRGAAAVVLHRVALAEKEGRARFPSLKAGEEVGEVCEDTTCDAAAFAGRFDGDDAAWEDVDVTTLDALARDDAAFDFVSLDVEGHDPLVLDGGPATIGNAGLVAFEYHFRGAWAADSLRRRSAKLDASGFDCFLEGAHGALWRLAGGCFDDAYEVRRWANVICARRAEVAWRAALLRWAAV